MTRTNLNNHGTNTDNQCTAKKKQGMQRCDRPAAKAYQRGLHHAPTLCCRQHGAMARELSFVPAPDVLRVSLALRESLAQAELDAISAIDAEIERLLLQRQAAIARYTTVIATLPHAEITPVEPKLYVKTALIRQLVGVATDKIGHLSYEAHPRTDDPDRRDGACLACHVITTAERMIDSHTQDMH